MPNKSSPHGGFISEGTISHGTLRTEDLLDTFGAELLRVMPFNGRTLASEANDYAARLASGKATDTEQTDAHEIICELMDQLDAIAQREGFYFGAHPGDGSDFGYWLPDGDEGQDRESYSDAQDRESYSAG